MKLDEKEDAAALLAAQLADLARYRHILEAQRAVVRMADAGLLDRFTSQARALVADISVRDDQLLSFRVAAQTAAATGPRAARLADLHAEVQRERALAGTEAQTLAAEIGRATQGVAEQIQRSGRALETVFGGYGSGSRVSVPSLFDRRG
ncbi:MAG TPA: hypothetical protein VGM77_09845 [Gemmatimonadales bacterium]